MSKKRIVVQNFIYFLQYDKLIPGNTSILKYLRGKYIHFYLLSIATYLLVIFALVPHLFWFWQIPFHQRYLCLQLVFFPHWHWSEMALKWEIIFDHQEVPLQQIDEWRKVYLPELKLVKSNVCPSQGISNETLDQDIC